MNQRTLVLGVISGVLLLAALGLIVWHFMPAPTPGKNRQVDLINIRTGERTQADWATVIKGTSGMDPFIAKWKYQLPSGDWAVVVEPGEPYDIEKARKAGENAAGH